MSAIAYPHHPRYHGWYPAPYAGRHGFCHSCCHPAQQCICSWRECRKEAKELLVTPSAAAHKPIEAVDPKQAEAERAASEKIIFGTSNAYTNQMLGSMFRGLTRGDTGQAFIGGGCCVHLSVEYASDAEGGAVAVYVGESDGTVMAWGKENVAQGYYIKEGIISTNPGARLMLRVSNVVARVRWCEVFSC